MTNVTVTLRVVGFSALVLIGGCATVSRLLPRYEVQVDSITAAAPDQTLKSRYVLLPGRQDIGANDLQYKEFAKYIDRAVQARGFIPATSPEEADIAILINYGIGEPQQTAYSYSSPVYGQRGGGSTTFTGTTIDSGGDLTTATGTIYQPPTFGVVGSETHTAVGTTYFRYLILEAVDVAAYRKSQTVVPVWKTTVTSSGSSGDLRRVLPVLVSAAAAYIATNTGQQVTMTLRESDPRVLQVKGQ